MLRSPWGCFFCKSQRCETLQKPGLTEKQPHRRPRLQEKIGGVGCCVWPCLVEENRERLRRGVLGLGGILGGLVFCARKLWARMVGLCKELGLVSRYSSPPSNIQVERE